MPALPPTLHGVEAGWKVVELYTEQFSHYFMGEREKREKGVVYGFMFSECINILLHTGAEDTTDNTREGEQ